VRGFEVGIHEDLTADALRPIKAKVRGRVLGFTPEAVAQVVRANAAIDAAFAADAFQHFDNEQFALASEHLVDLRECIIRRITSASPDGEAARIDLGSAFHTVQDFYAHTNYVELLAYGHAPATELGRDLLADPRLWTQPCPDRPDRVEGDGLRELTSGYFYAPEGCDENRRPKGKCYHGGGGCPGINKDSPGRPGYERARELALDASVAYVNLIVDDPRVAGNDEAMDVLMGIRV
jgi:von Willebrand factor A domain-containing protein 7